MTIRRGLFCCVQRNFLLRERSREIKTRLAMAKKVTRGTDSMLVDRDGGNIEYRSAPFNFAGIQIRNSDHVGQIHKCVHDDK